MAASPSAVDRNRSNMGGGNYSEIVYQNLGGLRKKLVQFLTKCVLSILNLYA
jgi:hypothetical protein